MRVPFVRYEDDAPMRAIGEGLLARNLSKPQWTHQAHLVATLYLLRERPDIDVDRALPGIIWNYNIASGTENTDSAGYHETITRFYILALRSFLARMTSPLPLHVLNNAIIETRFAAYDFPLDYYSRERLFSVEARRVWVEPDRAAFDFDRIELPAALAA